MRLLYLLALAPWTALGQQQQDGGLSTAIAGNPQLSGFRQIINSNPATFSSILPTTTRPSPVVITILIPSNAALDRFFNRTGVRFESLPADRQAIIMRYHVLAASLTYANFTAATSRRGFAVPTLLADQLFNNRTAGGGLVDQFGTDNAQGNVVFLSKDRLGPARLRVRQSSGSQGGGIRGGLGFDAGITAVDGVWSLGYFQIIDDILEPPAPCSKTVRTIGGILQSFDLAVNRSKLWTSLDRTANLTCLAPSNDGFKKAGDISSSQLENALLFHTFPQVTYTNFLQDGLSFTSLQGGVIVVSMVGDDIYFNDAKVVSPNVLTNNGLIHIIDRVMSPNGRPPSATTTVTQTVGQTSPPSSTSSPKNAATKAIAGDGAWLQLFGFAVAAAVMI